MSTLKIMTRKIASRHKGKEMDIEAYFEFFNLMIEIQTVLIAAFTLIIIIGIGINALTSKSLDVLSQSLTWGIIIFATSSFLIISTCVTCIAIGKESFIETQLSIYETIIENHNVTNIETGKFIDDKQINVYEVNIAYESESGICTDTVYLSMKQINDIEK